MSRPVIKTREQAVSIIESLWPPDCGDYPDIAAVGAELLEQAKLDVAGWRNEPDAVLFRLAELELDKELSQY